MENTNNKSYIQNQGNDETKGYNQKHAFETRNIEYADGRNEGNPETASNFNPYNVDPRFNNLGNSDYDIQL